MKTINSIVLAIVICVSLTACGGGGGGEVAPVEPPKPVYDITGEWKMWADSYSYDTNYPAIMGDVEKTAREVFDIYADTHVVRIGQNDDFTWHLIEWDDIRSDGTFEDRVYHLYYTNDFIVEDQIVYCDAKWLFVVEEREDGSLWMWSVMTLEYKMNDIEWEVELNLYLVPND
jgi:hypothetical protein